MSSSSSQFRWRVRRHHLPALLMLAGLLLLSYVGFEYYSMYGAQKRMARQWQAQNDARQTVSSPLANPLANNDGLTRVEIPKINLDAIVVEGVSRKELKIAPGHVPSSAIPGENGNSVITAHRDTFFRHIYELAKGDEILVRRNGEVFKFQVTGKRVVDPADVSVLDPTADPQLTLITCYPTYYIGPAPGRLVIFSKLMGRSPEAVASSKPNLN